MSRLQIIETGNRFGSISGINNYKARQQMATFYGFNPDKVYVPNQVADGSYQLVTSDMIKAKKDGWYLDITADILLVTEKTPNVVVGYPVADCAVVIMADLQNGVSATAHCSARLVDQKLPQFTLAALKDACGSKDENIFVYISACAGPSWSYDRYPIWIKDSSLWEESGALLKNGDHYCINLRKAIRAQLANYRFRQFIMNPADTITNDHYYSHHAAYLGNPKKIGHHFAGVFYKQKSVN